MFSKSLNIILISAIICVSERLVICDRLLYYMSGIIPEVNERILDLLPDDYYVKNELLVYKDCGGLLTSAPGKIEVDLTGFGHCTWELHAPEEQHVYIERVELSYMASLDIKREITIKIEMFDGDKSSQKLLYNKIGIGGDVNKAISSGRDLTIKATEAQTDIKNSVWRQNLKIQYHFINRQDYLKLKEN